MMTYRCMNRVGTARRDMNYPARRQQASGSQTRRESLRDARWNQYRTLRVESVEYVCDIFTWPGYVNNDGPNPVCIRVNV